MNYKGVMFDLDGTLIDTITDLATSTNSVMARHGFPVYPVASYKQFVGDGIAMLTRRALPENMRNEAMVRSCTAAVLEEYTQHSKDATTAYDGIHDMLKGLMLEEYRLTVLSNKPDVLTKELIHYYFPGIRFAGVFGARDNVPRKPDPAAALEILATLCIKPEECMYLGDSKTDMQTAVAAGMYPVGALWGFRDAQELLQYGAQALIEHPVDLIGVMHTLTRV
jgi:phosphoglycolate phosphatase